MGSNMQRQAVPLIKPTAADDRYRYESSVAKNSGQVVYSATDGIVTSASSDKIQVMDNNGETMTTNWLNSYDPTREPGQSAR